MKLPKLKKSKFVGKIVYNLFSISEKREMKK